MFGESASRVIVSLAEADLAAFLERADAAGVAATPIGNTGGTRLRIEVAGDLAIDAGVAELEEMWETAIERVFERKAA